MDLSSLSKERLESLTLRGSPALKAAVEDELARRQAGGLKSYARSLGQAAFNLGDEAEAFVRNGFSTGGEYDAIKGQINSEIQQSYNDNPLLYGLEFGTGMLIPGAGLAKLGKGAQTIRGMVGRGAGVGAVDGGLGGYGASTTGSELEGTLVGAGLGGALGGSISGLVPAISRFFKGQTDPNAIIREAAARRGISPEAVVEEMQRLGPDAVLADTFPEMTGIAMGAATKSPFNKSLGVLEERALSARDRLTSEIPGDGTTAQRQAENLTDEKTRVANEDYLPIDSATFMADDAASLLENPVAKSYVDEAINAYAANSRNPYNLGQLKKMMVGDPDANIPGSVPARILQDARSMMAEQANAYRSAVPPKKKKAAILEDSVRQFDELLGRIPGYTQANANFARASSEIEAIEQGRKIGRSNSKVADEQLELERITDPGLRDNVALGARSQIINDINTSGGLSGTGNPVSALGPIERRNLRAEAARLPNLGTALERESRFSETFNTVDPKRGSATAMRQEAVEQFDKDNAVIGALSDPISGGVGAAMLAGWRKFVGDKLNIRSQDVADQVLDVLLKRGLTPNEVKKIMENPEGVTELMKFLQGNKLRYGTGALTGAGLQTVAPLYEQN